MDDKLNEFVIGKTIERIQFDENSMTIYFTDGTKIEIDPGPYDGELRVFINHVRCC